MYDSIYELVYGTIEGFERMIQDIGIEFKSNIPLKDLKYYIDKINKTICEYVDKIQEELIEKFNKNNYILSLGRSEVKINNLKQNISLKLKRIYNKNENIQKYKKI